MSRCSQARIGHSRRPLAKHQQPDRPFHRTGVCYRPSTELPVPMPRSTTTTNSAVTDVIPSGNQMARTTTKVAVIIRITVLSGPSLRSDSQSGRLLPMTAPLRTTHPLVLATTSAGNHGGCTYTLYATMRWNCSFPIPTETAYVGKDPHSTKRTNSHASHVAG